MCPAHSKFTQRERVSGGHSAYSPSEMGNQVCLQSRPLFKFCNSLAAWCLVLYDAIIIRPSIWTLPDARSGCVVSYCCAPEEICEFKPPLAAFACERKDFLPLIHITSSLFICLRSKNYKMNSSAPLQLCGCDKRRFLFTIAFFLCFACAHSFSFSLP
jgi:hypothetical protein